jgi:hypothetical protein
MDYFIKNQPNWPLNEIMEELKIFSNIYKNRPIKNNIHGMLFPHMFATYFILKKINPSFVIESGVFKGQSTWLIEQALPISDILSIDINLGQREYISNKAIYSETDFKDQDFSNAPTDTLVFFDDHVNHLERLKQAKFVNIKNIILEDNYQSNEGDFYTIKHSYQNNGFNHKLAKISLLNTLLVFTKEIFKKFTLKNYYFNNNKVKSRLRDQAPNHNDFQNIKKAIDIYFEFPPIIDTVKNSTKPIFDKPDIDLEVSKEELKSYNYITYIKLL